MADKKTPFEVFGHSSNPQDPFKAKERTRRLQQSSARGMDVDSMLARMKEMNADLHSKLEWLSYKSGMSIERLMQMIEKRTPISARDKQRLDEQIQTFSKKVWDSVGRDIVPKKSPGDLNKSRKGKSLGSRKKWIPMR